MRQATGSGPVGLAGMAPVSEALGIRRLRPLLSVPKARLIATLTAAGRGWVVDPGNLSPAFARGRLRSEAGFDTAAHWEASLHHARRRTAQDRPWRNGWRRMCSRIHWAGPVSTASPSANARPNGEGFVGPAAGCRRRQHLSSMQARDPGPRRAGAGGRNGCALVRRRLYRRRPRPTPDRYPRAGPHPRCHGAGTGLRAALGRPLHGPLPQRPRAAGPGLSRRCGHRRSAGGRAPPASVGRDSGVCAGGPAGASGPERAGRLPATDPLLGSRHGPA